ncbi:hypothetical protein BCR33DRAFT_733050 [Rhizoclosmatium globosum]|uniref:Uncharacterized protein n=1 Tax=Rhizoclosmatium globosum TaxID=329046 RepID=A0A1Y2CZJ7_9FUNG|nr:hypothetical protein BCR33DRAFT_733050 [Rhizoclosmatium globosum]|eukprot:ORY52294.1 hypothetical protein BCR33DRAFT_733050 [Rhizoclosmatium globosum]
MAFVTPLRSTASQASASNPLARSCVEKAKEIHASVYSTWKHFKLRQQSTSREHKASVISAYYAPRSTFNDPLVSVQGLHAVTQQLMFIALFPAVKSRISHVSWTHLGTGEPEPGLSESGCRTELVVIDAVVTFTLVPFLPQYLSNITLRILTHLTFDASGRVISHEDVWSFSEALGSAFNGSENKWIRVDYFD